MAKYKIHVNGNNQIASNQQPVNAVVQQIAQNTAAQQSQQPQASEQDNMRITVNDLIKNSLINPVEIPRYTTIKDVLNAPKGEKLSSFVDFLGTPESMRTIGNFLPKYGYNPKTGQLGNVMEESARRQETQFEADRQKALEQLKLQNALAGNVYDAYNRMDIADKQNQLRRDLAKEELEWRKQENALDRALKRDSLNAQIAHQRAMESIARDRLGAGGGRILPATLVEDMSGTLQGVKQMNDLYSKIPELSDRLTTPGAAQASTFNPWDTDAQGFKQYVKSYKQVIGKGLEGGVLRKEDEAKYEDIIPKVGDTKETLFRKTEQLGQMLVDKYNTNMDFYAAAGYNTSKIQNIPVPSEFLNKQSDTVKVKAPNGKTGTIPRANLKKALEQGYKEIK